MRMQLCLIGSVFLVAFSAGSAYAQEEPQVLDASATASCPELVEQNKSLRETIRAQNEYLLNFDNSGQISKKLVDENASLKSKVFYLEQASKSSAEEIKRLMVINENLKKELAQYKPPQTR